MKELPTFKHPTRNIGLFRPAIPGSVTTVPYRIPLEGDRWPERLIFFGAQNLVIPSGVDSRDIGLSIAEGITEF